MDRLNFTSTKWPHLSSKPDWTMFYHVILLVEGLSGVRWAHQSQE